MMDRQRVMDFFSSFRTDRGSARLSRIRKEAFDSGVPIIRRQTEDLLAFFIRCSRPSRILEVGSAVGYSALFMAEAAQSPTEITTIEVDRQRCQRARANIAAMGMEDRIHLIEGDAVLLLKDLAGPFDFIFMDAAKGQYIHFFPHVMRLLAPGGLLISDNILQDGHVIESRYGIRRRNHTIHKRMRDYLYTLTHTQGLDTLLLESGDGVAVSRKWTEGKG